MRDGSPTHSRPVPGGIASHGGSSLAHTTSPYPSPMKSKFSSRMASSGADSPSWNRRGNGNAPGDAFGDLHTPTRTASGAAGSADPAYTPGRGAYLPPGRRSVDPSPRKADAMPGASPMSKAVHTNNVFSLDHPGTPLRPPAGTSGGNGSGTSRGGGVRQTPGRPPLAPGSAPASHVTPHYIPSQAARQLTPPKVPQGFALAAMLDGSDT
eukprot:118015-Chlamydomonas_euryale.AAC.1